MPNCSMTVFELMNTLGFVKMESSASTVKSPITLSATNFIIPLSFTCTVEIARAPGAGTLYLESGTCDPNL